MLAYLLLSFDINFPVICIYYMIDLDTKTNISSEVCNNDEIIISWTINR